MTHQLLWIETLLKLAGGLILLFLPITAARTIGLPHGNIGLWPRLVGALLIGIAGALYLEGVKLSQLRHGGLGLGGMALINLTVIFSIGAFLAVDLVKTVLARLVLWMLMIALTILSVLELAAS
jgi:hypothetical protein